MTYSLVTDTQEQIEFASTTGWGDVIRWGDSLDDKKYPELVHLVDYGWTQETKKLVKEIQAAIKEDPPEKTVLSTLKLLIAFVDKHQPAAFVVSTGLGPDSS